MLGQVNLACKKKCIIPEFLHWIFIHKLYKAQYITLSLTDSLHDHVAKSTYLLFFTWCQYNHFVGAIVVSQNGNVYPVAEPAGSHFFHPPSPNWDVCVCKCCNNIPAVSTFWLFLILVSIQLMQFIQPHWWWSFIPVENDPGCITLLFYENKWSCLSDKEMERESPIFQANFCSFFGALL